MALTPTLTDQQIRENLNALQKAGKSVEERQSYVNQYQKGVDGNYALKTQQSPSEKMGLSTNITGDIAKNYTETIKSAVPNFVTGDMGTIIKDLGKVDPGKNKIVQVGENALQATVDALGVIFAPFTATAKAVTDRISANIEQNPEIINSPAMQHVADFVTKVSEPIQKAITEHPEAAQNIGNALNIITTALMGKAGSKLGVPGEGLDTSIGTVKGILQGTQNIITEQAKGVSSAVQGVKSVIGEKMTTPLPTKPEVVGRITGATGSDVGVASKGLKTPSVDLKTPLTKGNEYADLGNRIQKGIDVNQKTVDTAFAKDTSTHTIKDFVQTVGEGKSVVKINPVKQGIEDLKAYYTKTGDAKGLSKIKELEIKANKTGLTYGEVNNLAKEHGSSINAFNANGEAATGLTKQAAENTRTGLKTIAREGLGNSEVKALDQQTSSMIKTKEMVSDLTEKVQKFKNTYREGSKMQKLGANIAKWADRLTGGSLKGVIKEITGRMGAGEGTKLNILELQSELQKNLDLFNKLIDMKPEDAAKLLEIKANGLPSTKVPNLTNQPKISSGVSKKVQGETLPTKLSKETETWAKQWLWNSDEGMTLKMTPIVEKELSQYKPSKPVKLYRGVDRSAPKKSPFSSWTYNKEAALEHAGEEGKVISRIVKPDEILTDFTEMPSKVRSKLHIIDEEEEVLVKNK